MRTIIGMLCVSAILLTGIDANALTVSTGSTLNSIYLGSGSVSGSFDMRSYLDASNYTIDSATIVFTFLGDTLTTANRYSTGYQLNSMQQRGSTIIDRTYSRYSFNDNFSSIESVTLVTDSGTARSQSSSYFSNISDPVFAYDAYNSHAGDSDFYCDNYYSYTYSRTYGYGGSYTISDTLNSAELAALSDGIFDFSLTGYGTSLLTGATLTVSMSQNPVPEPSTLILFGAGVAGIVFWRSRKNV